MGQPTTLVKPAFTFSLINFALVAPSQSRDEPANRTNGERRTIYCHAISDPPMPGIRAACLSWAMDPDEHRRALTSVVTLMTRRSELARGENLRRAPDSWQARDRGGGMSKSVAHGWYRSAQDGEP